MREVVSGFLWFPKTINGEWRWLTYNSWERISTISYDSNKGAYEQVWKNNRWVDGIDPAPTNTSPAYPMPY